ncbi:hypothetical protein SK128_013842 [Halocaridina rubra]|uniref:Uncharacterized protein n=1 Tax=Halocaridina rubra TaxID=373956 RepID=A0AAN8WR95_HALRR
MEGQVPLECKPKFSNLKDRETHGHLIPVQNSSGIIDDTDIFLELQLYEKSLKTSVTDGTLNAEKDSTNTLKLENEKNIKSKVLNSSVRDLKKKSKCKNQNEKSKVFIDEKRNKVNDTIQGNDELKTCDGKKLKCLFGEEKDKSRTKHSTEKEYKRKKSPVADKQHRNKVQNHKQTENAKLHQTTYEKLEEWQNDVNSCNNVTNAAKRLTNDTDEEKENTQSETSGTGYNEQIRKQVDKFVVDEDPEMAGSKGLKKKKNSLETSKIDVVSSGRRLRSSSQQINLNNAMIDQSKKESSTEEIVGFGISNCSESLLQPEYSQANLKSKGSQDFSKTVQVDVSRHECRQDEDFSNTMPNLHSPKNIISQSQACSQRTSTKVQQNFPSKENTTQLEFFQNINALLGHSLQSSVNDKFDTPNFSSSSLPLLTCHTANNNLQKVPTTLETPGKQVLTRIDNNSEDSSSSESKSLLPVEKPFLRRSPRKKGKVSQLDLYEDFIISRNEEKKTKEVEAIQSEVADIQTKLLDTEKICKELDEENKTLLMNISSLWKVATAEIREKSKEIQKLKRELESIIFRRAMRQIPKDELDRVVTRISAYDKEEFGSFIETLQMEKQECNCGSSGKVLPVMKVTAKKITANVKGQRVKDLSHTSDAQSLKTFLGKQGEKITTSKEKIPKILKPKNRKFTRTVPSYRTPGNRYSRSKVFGSKTRKYIHSNRAQTDEQEKCYSSNNDSSDKRYKRNQCRSLEESFSMSGSYGNVEVDRSTSESYICVRNSSYCSDSVSAECKRKKIEDGNKKYDQKVRDKHSRLRSHDYRRKVDYKSLNKNAEYTATHESCSKSTLNSDFGCSRDSLSESHENLKSSTGRSDYVPFNEDTFYREYNEKSHENLSSREVPVITQDSNTDITDLNQEYRCSRNREGNYSESLSQRNVAECSKGGGSLLHQKELEITVAEQNMLSRSLYGMRMKQKLKGSQTVETTVADNKNIIEDSRQRHQEEVNKKVLPQENAQIDCQNSVEDRQPVNVFPHYITDNETSCTSSQEGTNIRYEEKGSKETNSLLNNSEVSPARVESPVLSECSMPKPKQVVNNGRKVFTERESENHESLGDDNNYSLSLEEVVSRTNKEGNLIENRLRNINSENKSSFESHVTPKSKTVKSGVPNVLSKTSCDVINFTMDCLEKADRVRTVDSGESSFEKHSDNIDRRTVFQENRECNSNLKCTRTFSSHENKEFISCEKLQDTEGSIDVGEDSNMIENSLHHPEESDVVQKGHTRSNTEQESVDRNIHIRTKAKTHFEKAIFSDAKYKEHHILGNSDVYEKTAEHNIQTAKTKITMASSEESDDKKENTTTLKDVTLETSSNDTADFEIVYEALTRKKSSMKHDNRVLRYDPAKSLENLSQEKSSREICVTEIVEEEKCLSYEFMKSIMETVMYISNDDSSNDSELIDIENLFEVGSSKLNKECNSYPQKINEKEVQQFVMEDHGLDAAYRNESISTTKSNDRHRGSIEKQLDNRISTKTRCSDKNLSNNVEIEKKKCTKYALLETEKHQKVSLNRRKFPRSTEITDGLVNYCPIEDPFSSSSNVDKSAQLSVDCVEATKEAVNQKDIELDSGKIHTVHENSSCSQEYLFPEEEPKHYGGFSDYGRNEDAVSEDLDLDATVNVPNTESSEEQNISRIVDKEFDNISSVGNVSREKDSSGNPAPVISLNSFNTVPVGCGSSEGEGYSENELLTPQQVKSFRIPKVKKSEVIRNEGLGISPLHCEENIIREQNARNKKHLQRRGLSLENSPESTDMLMLKSNPNLSPERNPRPPQKFGRISKLPPERKSSLSLDRKARVLLDKDLEHVSKRNLRQDPKKNSRYAYDNDVRHLSESSRQSHKRHSRDREKVLPSRNRRDQYSPKREQLAKLRKAGAKQYNPQPPEKRSRGGNRILNESDVCFTRERTRRGESHKRRDDTGSFKRKLSEKYETERPVKKRRIGDKGSYKIYSRENMEADNSYRVICESPRSNRRSSQRIQNKIYDKREKTKSASSNAIDRVIISRRIKENSSILVGDHSSNTRSRKVNGQQCFVSRIVENDKELAVPKQIKVNRELLLTGLKSPQEPCDVDNEKEEGELDEDEDDIEENTSNYPSEVLKNSSFADKKRGNENQLHTGDKPRKLEKQFNMFSNTDKVSTNSISHINCSSLSKENVNPPKTEMEEKFVNLGSGCRVINEVSTTADSSFISENKMKASLVPPDRTDSRTKKLANLIEDATICPQDLYQVKSLPLVSYPNQLTSSRASGSDDTIDMIVKKHNNECVDPVSNCSDDSEMSLLHYIDEEQLESVASKQEIDILQNIVINKESVHKDSSKSDRESTDGILRKHELCINNSNLELTGKAHYNEKKIDLNSDDYSGSSVLNRNVLTDAESSDTIGNQLSSSLACDLQLSNSSNISLSETHKLSQSENMSHFLKIKEHEQEANENSLDAQSEILNNEGLVDDRNGGRSLERTDINAAYDCDQHNSILENEVLKTCNQIECSFSPERDNKSVCDSPLSSPYEMEEDSDTSDSDSSCSECSKCGKDDGNSSSSESTNSSTDSDLDENIGELSKLHMPISPLFSSDNSLSKTPAEGLGKSPRRTPVKSILSSSLPIKARESTSRSPCRSPCKTIHKTPRKTPCKKTHKPLFSSLKTQSRTFIAVNNKEKIQKITDDTFCDAVAASLSKEKAKSTGIHENSSQRTSQEEINKEVSHEVSIWNNSPEENIVKGMHEENNKSGCCIEVNTKNNSEEIERKSEDENSRHCNRTGNNHKSLVCNLDSISSIRPLNSVSLSQGSSSSSMIFHSTIPCQSTASNPNIEMATKESKDMINIIKSEREVKQVASSGNVVTPKKRKYTPTIEKESPEGKTIRVLSPDMFPEVTARALSHTPPKSNEGNNLLSQEKVFVVDIKRKKIRRQLNLGLSSSESSRVLVTSVQSPSIKDPKASAEKNLKASGAVESNKLLQNPEVKNVAIPVRRSPRKR